jgi:uncharacterized Ntn-hydrolase superfamily protein
MRVSGKFRLILFPVLAAGLAWSGLTGGVAADPADAAGSATGRVARDQGQPLRPVNTYSIVARDPDTGEMGVAVQSHWFSVGPLVPWAEAGVGAVATQSFVEVSYGPLGLELMRAGKTAPLALQSLLASDENAAVRQVAMIDKDGNVAAHTGDHCIAAAGHRSGENFSVQANLMLNDTVWGAMAAAYEATTGPLAERMLAALEAAEAEGGDIRGKQSAAILVVRGESTGRPWEDRLVDLRIEDHPAPIPELKRILTLHRAYERMNRGDAAVTAGDIDGALLEYAAAEAMVPDSAEMIFWHAVTLVGQERIEDSLPLFARSFALDPNWVLVVPRLVPSGLLPDDDELIGRIAAAGSGGR